MYHMVSKYQVCQRGERSVSKVNTKQNNTFTNTSAHTTKTEPKETILRLMYKTFYPQTLSMAFCTFFFCTTTVAKLNQIWVKHLRIVNLTILYRPEKLLVT